MKQENYQTSITVNAAPKKIFEAITLYIPQWWSESFNGHANKIKETFTVRFDSTFMTFSIGDIVQDKKIVWECEDAFTDIPSVHDKKEWIGTRVIWEITAEGNETTVAITHIGLTPAFECFDVCEKGWQFYFGKSLYKFLTLGKGIPFNNSTAGEKWQAIKHNAISKSD